MEYSKTISTEDVEALLLTLNNRFHTHKHRHKDINWDKVLIKLRQSPQSCTSLCTMESTGGEPDVVAYDPSEDRYLFMDCSPESPVGRRSLCYDRAGLLSRKENQPKDSALDMASAMGIEILDEADYRYLQELEHVDTKTSSWILTPESIRQLGGALFGDFRYGTVFIYHNGAQSYYAARAFRGKIWV
jgi:hypothetical protein